jgi:ATP-dependent Clp protease ATP-binding subunit ClpC
LKKPCHRSPIHPEVWNVLLQLMDDGRLTDGEGRTVDFTNTVVVMTSNLGAGRARGGLGFTAGAEQPGGERMLAAAKSARLPGFLNRIDEIVTFAPLTPERRSRSARSSSPAPARGWQAERGIALDVRRRSSPG